MEIWRGQWNSRSIGRYHPSRAQRTVCPGMGQPGWMVTRLKIQRVSNEQKFTKDQIQHRGGWTIHTPHRVDIDIAQGVHATNNLYKEKLVCHRGGHIGDYDGGWHHTCLKKKGGLGYNSKLMACKWRQPQQDSLNWRMNRTYIQHRVHTYSKGPG